MELEESSRDKEGEVKGRDTTETQSNVCLSAGSTTGWAETSHRKQHSLCPFYIEDKMIVAKTRDTSNSTCCVLSSVEVDEGKTLHKAHDKEDY